MKRIHFSNRLLTHSTIWMGCAAVCCSLSLQISATAGTPAPAPASTPAPAPELNNSIGFTVGGGATYGDEAAFQRRFSQNGDFYGGISNLDWQGEVADGLTLDLEGHAVFGQEDYGFLGTLTKADLGYVQVGYSQFRTWYDGSGGYVPGVADSWVELYDDDLSVDRGKVWFEAGLRLEDMPEFTFRYTHSWRDGSKDSTSWGTSASGFKSLPSYTQIDETTDKFSLDFTHTLGNTDFGGGLSFESIENEDTRVMYNKTTAAANRPATRVVDTAANDADIFNGHLFSETRLGEQLMFGLGYSYTNFDTDIGGDRPSRNVDDNYLRTASDHALWGIAGGTQGNINVLDGSLLWTPNDSLTVVPSVRAEFWDNGGWADHVAGVRTAGNVAPNSAADGIVEAAIGGVYPVGANAGRLEEYHSYNSDQYQEYEEAIEIRYNGLDDVLLYGRAEFTQLDGELNRLVTEDLHNGAVVDNNYRNTETETDKQKYTLGANWYPVRGLSFSAQAYYKNSDSYYNHYVLTGSEDAQLRQSNFETTDMNVRLTWRAMPNLTLVTRYDYQQSTFESQGYYTGKPVLNLIESGDVESHILSQSVTWMPVSRAYVQGFVSLVASETDTPASAMGVPDSSNDYLTASVTCGYALDDRTDITASYSYYYSDNFAQPMNAAGVATAMGYGSSIQENVFSLSLNRQINDNMLWNIGYGYYIGEDDASGGYNDFSAHMFSTGLQIRF